jgi:hypothetical protein
MTLNFVALHQQERAFSITDSAGRESAAVDGGARFV